MGFLVAQTSRYQRQLDDFESGVRTLTQDRHHRPENLKSTVKDYRRSMAKLIWQIRNSTKVSSESRSSR